MSGKKQKVSILLPAYKADTFIEECLDSIEKQTYFTDNDKFEVLAGIDGCKQTLRTITGISHKYRNLRVIMLENNSGAYITLNTLLGLITSNNIIVFGSDDIMRPYLVSEVIEASKHADIVMMCYNAFISDTRDARRVTEYAHGAIYFRKRVIDLAGGYRPWRCAADTELLQRVAKRVKPYRIEKPLFYRRIHENSLTSRKATGRTSELRKEYMKLIRTYEVDEDIHIERTTEIFREV